jgi:hypothetical protein
MALLTTIERDGQEFLDEPVYVHPKKLSLIEASIAKAFNIAMSAPIAVRHERVKLRWMKPDGKGGLCAR